MADDEGPQPAPDSSETGQTDAPSSGADSSTAHETPTVSEPSPEDAQESCEVRAAADAVHRAKEELKKARQLYRELRKTATGHLKEVREKTVADVVDDTLDLVKKHPGPGVLVALAIGFFLGRLFRR